MEVEDILADVMKNVQAASGKNADGSPKTGKVEAAQLDTTPVKESLSDLGKVIQGTKRNIDELQGMIAAGVGTAIGAERENLQDRVAQGKQLLDIIGRQGSNPEDPNSTISKLAIVADKADQAWMADLEQHKKNREVEFFPNPIEFLGARLRDNLMTQPSMRQNEAIAQEASTRIAQKNAVVQSTAGTEKLINDVTTAEEATRTLAQFTVDANIKSAEAKVKLGIQSSELFNQQLSADARVHDIMASDAARANADNDRRLRDLLFPAQAIREVASAKSAQLALDATIADEPSRKSILENQVKQARLSTEKMETEAADKLKAKADDIQGWEANMQLYNAGAPDLGLPIATSIADMQVKVQMDNATVLKAISRGTQLANGQVALAGTAGEVALGLQVGAIQDRSTLGTTLKTAATEQIGKGIASNPSMSPEAKVVALNDYLYGRIQVTERGQPIIDPVTGKVKTDETGLFFRWKQYADSNVDNLENPYRAVDIPTLEASSTKLFQDFQRDESKFLSEVLRPLARHTKNSDVKTITSMAATVAYEENYSEEDMLRLAKDVSSFYKAAGNFNNTHKSFTKLGMDLQDSYMSGETNMYNVDQVLMKLKKMRLDAAVSALPNQFGFKTGPQANLPAYNAKPQE